MSEEPKPAVGAREKIVSFLESCGLVICLLAGIAAIAWARGNVFDHRVVPIFAAGFALWGIPPIFSDRFAARSKLGKAFVVLSVFLCLALLAILVFDTSGAR